MLNMLAPSAFSPPIHPYCPIGAYDAMGVDLLLGLGPDRGGERFAR